MFTRAHTRAALLVAAFVLAGCSDYSLQSDPFTAPAEGTRSLRLSQDSVMLPVGKAIVLSATLISGGQSVAELRAVPRPNTYVNVSQPVGQPMSWQSSDTAVAVVNDSGKVKAVGPGTATVTATVAGASATSTVTVPSSPSAPVAPPASGALGVTPELPRVTVDVTMPTGTGRSIQVAAGGDLQAAINASTPGDQILLPAGATFTGNYTLPAKSGTGWVIIRTTGSLPSAGTRVHPGDASQMAKIVAADPSYPVFQTALGAHNYRLVGLEMTAQPGATQGFTLVALGDGSSAQNSVDKVAHDLVLDRDYIHGTPTLNFQRCIGLNSGSTAIVDSYISDCHGKGMDSQVIAGWNGSGPYRIENNYLEGSGENVMFGGADPQIPNMLPRDIVIRHNYFYKPVAWKGVWEVKNLLEVKIGQRVLIDGNVFENNWADAQDGFAILFKSVNQGGAAPWSETSDVTFQNNIVKNTPNVVNLAAHPEANPVVPAGRIKFSNNVFESVGTGGGKLFEISGIQGLTIQHNTGFRSVGTGDDLGPAFVLYAPVVTQLVIVDNIVGPGWSSLGCDVAFGAGALNTYASPGWVFRRNVVPMASRVSTYPTDNFYPSSTSDVGLGATLALPSGSPYLTAATDGTAIGANISVINAATAGVTQ